MRYSMPDPAIALSVPGQRQIVQFSRSQAENTTAKEPALKRRPQNIKRR